MPVRNFGPDDADDEDNEELDNPGWSTQWMRKDVLKTPNAIYGPSENAGGVAGNRLMHRTMAWQRYGPKLPFAVVSCSFVETAIQRCFVVQRISVLALMCLLCSIEDIHASLEIDAFSAESPAAVAQLECVGRERNKLTISLGGVLDTQLDSIPDIVLVAAHGLGNTADQCVISFRGRRLGISRIERGQSNDIDGDWAVLTLDGRFPTPIHRLGWYIDSAAKWESFAVNGGRVSLLKFANGETGKSCEVRIPRGGMADSNDGNALLLSDCVSMPGMSGGPAIVEVDGLPTMIGLNIGTRYDLSDPPLEWRRRANIIRLVDAAVEDAIVRAIASEMP